jgi:hypothetical protein
MIFIVGRCVPTFSSNGREAISTLAWGSHRQSVCTRDRRSLCRDRPCATAVEEGPAIGIVKRADPSEPAGLCERRLSRIVDRAQDQAAGRHGFGVESIAPPEVQRLSRRTLLPITTLNRDNIYGIPITTASLNPTCSVGQLRTTGSLEAKISGGICQCKLREFTCRQPIR